MQFILSDHNCEGQAQVIFNRLRHQGYTALASMELLLFRDVGLHHNADDEKVWMFCQEQGYILLTGNRTTTDGNESLERTIRRLIKRDSLPVVTISNLRRVKTDPDYCQHCAEGLAEIILDLALLRGVPRLYIPS